MIFTIVFGGIVPELGAIPEQIQMLRSILLAFVSGGYEIVQLCGKVLNMTDPGDILSMFISPCIIPSAGFCSPQPIINIIQMLAEPRMAASLP